MRGKLTVPLLVGAICLLGATAAPAYNQAPMLTALVDAGKLDPLEQRLPEEPQILEPIEEIGQYGGTMHVFTTAADSILGPHMILMGDALLRIAPDLSTILPSIAKDWEYSEGGKTLTLYLRKGMKWSDGAPFTAEDIMFWYEDILLNDELVPAKPSSWTPGGELLQVEKIDDYTVRFNFVAPYPLMEVRIAHWEGQQCAEWLVAAGPYAPKHYLTQFHLKYNPEADELAKEEEYEHWYQLFLAKARCDFGMPMSVGLPTLSAYVCKEKETDYLIYERNPYYWKIDPEGNQLPYIDRYRVKVVENAEMIEAKIMTGEVDFEGQYVTLENYPLYKKNAEKAGYRVLLYDNSYSSNVWIQWNQTVKDLVLREIFQDVRFRRALSLAIDREEISEILFFGLAEPRQISVLDDSMYFEPEFATAYIEYDPERANQLLNEMGLEWDENHEYRLRPDGERLGAILEYTVVEPCETPVLEMVKEYWEKVGFDMTLKEEDISLYGTRIGANEVQMGDHQACAATDVLFIQWASAWFPWRAGWEATWCIGWGAWYASGGESEIGVEPPAQIKRLLEIYEEMQITLDKDKLIQLGKEVSRGFAENLWSGIGTVRVPYPLIVKNNLRNVPEKGIWGWDGYYGYIYHPEQFFFKQD